MMIVLLSSDGETFEVEESIAQQSVTIKNIIEDGYAADRIPLPKVDGKTLAKVIEFCKHHATNSGVDKQYDKQFAQSVKDDQDMMFGLILAANFLNIKELQDALCQQVADMMREKTPEEIRTTFHIKNDYSEQEMTEVRKENAWAFE
ncbi:SKP1-like 4 [Perilla frutescens var. hirtella]|uniref:SKP1-like protein n=1 Tax=Perilla frutescens var. hirtella TaxID=608512 RepID=A0AAD4JD30_PERFH|nr:SKP1-like 4 [Perilla frutescens var. hirtella]